MFIKWPPHEADKTNLKKPIASISTCRNSSSGKGVASLASGQRSNIAVSVAAAAPIRRCRLPPVRASPPPSSSSAFTSAAAAASRPSRPPSLPLLRQGSPEAAPSARARRRRGMVSAAAAAAAVAAPVAGQTLTQFLATIVVSISECFSP